MARQEEKFVFRIRGRGPGLAPEVTNYPDRGYPLVQPLLPFADRERTDPAASATNFEVLSRVLFASSAFPLAFPPQEIGYCLHEPSELDDDLAIALRECPAATRRARFVDGGVFDNDPLRLAYRTAVAGLRRTAGGGLEWAPAAHTWERVPPAGVFFLHLDPNHAAYPAERGEEVEDGLADLFPTARLFLRSFLESAQSKELATLIEENPEVRNRMTLAGRDLPSASGQLLNFFGFFDREFRVYDFTLGMRDARAFVAEKLEPAVERARGEPARLTLPERAGAAERPEAWRRFSCLRAVVDPSRADAREACRGLEDFRILLQVSLDRLYDHCARLPFDETVASVHCKRAMEGASAPRVPGVIWDGSELARDPESENEFEHTMRLLETYRFHFEDLGLEREDGARAMTRIRAELLRYVEALADKQPPGQKAAIRILGKPAVNFLKYAPPELILHAAFGTASEVGLSSSRLPTGFLRGTLALQIRGTTTLLGEETNIVSFTPALGLEIEPMFLSGPWFQLRFGVRAGYQLSTFDRFSVDSCDADRVVSDETSCSAPVAQGLLAVSIYERLRLQGVVEWFPRWLPPLDALSQHLFAVHLEIGWQWISPF